MRLFTLALVAFGFSFEASASHFIDCDLEAKVVAVKHLGRLDGESTFFNRPGAFGDHEQTVEIEVTKVLQVSGRDRSCLTVGTKVELAVKANQIGNYNVTQVLKINYRNVGDRPGSRISYLVK